MGGFTITFIRLFWWGIYLSSPLLVFLGVEIIVMGLFVCRIEQWKTFDGVYWSFITATTVGYGDIRPLKKVSKLLSVLIGLAGLMFTGIIVAVTLHTATIAFEKHADMHVIEKVQEKKHTKRDKK